MSMYIVGLEVRRGWLTDISTVDSRSRGADIYSHNSFSGVSFLPASVMFWYLDINNEILPITRFNLAM